jgi:hypothetical protein
MLRTEILSSKVSHPEFVNKCVLSPEVRRNRPKSALSESGVPLSMPLFPSVQLRTS